MRRRRRRLQRAALARRTLAVKAWEAGLAPGPPMWCVTHQRLEYGPGSGVSAKDHRRFGSLDLVTEGQP